MIYLKAYLLEGVHEEKDEGDVFCPLGSIHVEALWTGRKQRTG